MPNAKDLEQSNQIRFLVAGYMGSGKTNLVKTLPGRKFMYVFDPNALQTIRGTDIDYEEFIPDVMDLDLSVKTLKQGVGDRPRSKREPITYVEWEKDFEQKHEKGFFEQYDWLCFDSFTNFLEIIMDRVQFLNGRLGKQPEQADWAAQMITCQNVWRVLTGLKLGVYATAHLDLRQNETSKKTYNHLMMTGRLRVRIPQLFNNVWTAHADLDDKGRPHFLMQTYPDKEYPSIRTQFATEPFEDVTIPSNLPKGADLSQYGLGALLRKFGYFQSDKKRASEKAQVATTQKV